MLLTSKIKCRHPERSLLRQVGFTLVELMVAVAILGILASIALPNYLEHLKKGRRAAAQAVMMDAAQKQQQYFLDARSYASDLATLDVTTPADVSVYYTITIEAADGPPPTFKVTATPVSGSAQAGDGELTLDNVGVKTPVSKW